VSGILAILGAGGHGAVVADTALAAGWREVRFFDDGYPATSRCEPWEVAGNSADLLSGITQVDGVVVAIGNNAARLEQSRRLAAAGARLATLIHPRAWVSPRALVGFGTVVLAGAVVNARAAIGMAVILNTGATIDHDCVLADGVHISPGGNLAGRVRVGERGWVGIGAAVRDGISLGRDVVAGAGAVIVADVGDGLTVVGNPARPLER
jgi:sugar O-acyltransferase (sialic acid O-acetyltransferase NeuD family)